MATIKFFCFNRNDHLHREKESLKGYFLDQHVLLQQRCHWRPFFGLRLSSPVELF